MFNENIFEKTLESLEDGILALDGRGRLLYANPAARQAFGIGEKAPAGRPIHELIQNQEILELTFENKRSLPRHTETALENGQVFSVQIAEIPGAGLAISLHDITHLKELDRIKTDFVNTVSHDLRSPLTAILGYVELIGRVGPLSEQQIEFARRAQNSVRSITALINDLLELGRIEAGFDVRKEVVALPEVLHYAIDVLRSRADENAHTLALDVPDDLPCVLGNPTQLRQMLTNLVGNAIAYTPPGGNIQILTRAEGEQVILQVTDNGLGIPPGDLPHIFDKFYRASNVTGDTVGTGLGLAIVKTVVDNHQGRVWVDSHLGKGSSFTVVLPVAEISEQL